MGGKRHTSPKWRSFLEARAFVRSKGVTSHADWLRYCRSGEKPDDIPTHPDQTYKAEWRGLGDWLGTGAVATQDRQFRSFQAARAFVRSKGLTSGADWTRYCRSGERPDDIPTTPNQTYKAEWRGWRDWFGTEYRSFQAARAFVRSKGLTKLREWKTFCRSGGKPDDIPATPEVVYKAEWRGTGDWLGTGAVATQDRQFRSFQAARAFVRSKGVTSHADWLRYCRSGEKPDDIPTNPNQTYKAEWRGTGDWLGTGAVATQDRQFRSFQAARAFVRSKGLTNQAEWRAFCRSGDKPDDIPATPEVVYKAEWRGLGDWLGTGAVATQDRRYRSFQAARAFVRSKGLTNQAEWKTFCRSGGKPDDIPAHPELVYKAEWRGMGDWLGTGAVAPR